VRTLGASLALDGGAPRPVARCTAAGAELSVRGRVVARLALDAPKYRMAANAPPDRRDGFQR
jgi:hypothetical protein